MSFVDAGSDAVTRALVDCTFFTRIANALLSAGARVDTKNARGETALHVAHPFMVGSMRKHLVTLAGKKKGDTNKRKSERWQHWRAAMRTISMSGRVPSVSDTWATRTRMRRVEKAAAAAVVGKGVGASPGALAGNDGLRCDIPTVHASDLTPERFMREFLGENRPVLVLDGTRITSVAVESFAAESEEHDDATARQGNFASENSWESARRTWLDEDWLKREAGHQRVVSGTIPYPRQFNVPHEHDSLSNFLISSSPLKGEEEAAGRVPKPYLFHSIDLQRPWDEVLGDEISQNLGNFSSALGDGGAYLFETAQFYHGGAGSGAPMHFHGNAINALLKGAKKWTLLPPGAARYSRKHPVQWQSAAPEGEYPGALVCHQPAESFMFVPKGWSHAVLNTAEASRTVGVAVEFVFMGSRRVKEEFLGLVRNASRWSARLGLQKAMAI